MLQIENPFPQFNDLQGDLLDAGLIYIGVSGADPESSPVQCYWDKALTIPATQPLRTRGGLIVNNGSPAAVYVGASDYSMRVRDADGGLVWYIRSAIANATASYQPLDADLTAIAALSTQSFGRSLLTAATDVAARALLGIGNFLATAGGTMTGNIVRSGAGAHIYFADAAMTKPVIYLTTSGAADPRTGAPGEIWLKY